MFAEIRAEGINPNLAKKLKKANFYKLEIGMQSINKQTLKNVMRYGSPEKVIEVSKMLVSEGIELLLDLIVGLPGDSPQDVLEGVEFFKTHKLEEYLQVFPLSVLPGTAMRATAKSLGIEYLSSPPYRVQKTPTFPEGQIAQTLLKAEEILGTRIDEHPRPHLVKPRYLLDSDQAFFFLPRHLERHTALWFEGNRPHKQKDKLFPFLQRVINQEPFITIDFIFYTETVLPIEFLVEIRKFLNQQPKNYLKYSLSHRNEDMQHRIVLLLKETFVVEPEYIAKVSNLCFVFQDMSFQKALALGNKLGFTYPNARITDKIIPISKLEELAQIVDPETVCFEGQRNEKNWTLHFLGYSDID